MKYEFWFTKVTFLGKVVSNEGIKVDPQNIKTVTKWRRPTNMIEVKSFLCLT